jgi:hypothetical protein
MYQLVANKGLLEISWKEIRGKIYNPEDKISDLLLIEKTFSETNLLDELESDTATSVVRIKGKCSPQVIAYLVCVLVMFFDVIAIWDEGLGVFIVSYSENNSIYQLGDKLV